MTATTISNWKELASRECDGLVVSLLWNRTSDRVKVAVVDARLDEDLEFRVAGADALAAFYHPFAYAPRSASVVRSAAASPSTCASRPERNTP